MPLSFSTKALLTLGTVTVAGLWIRERGVKKRRRRRRPAAPPAPAPAPETPGPKSRDEGCLFKVFDEGATIGDFPRIMNDLHPSLKTDEVAATVVDIAPHQGDVIYDYMKHLVAEKELDLEQPADRDQAIKRTLAVTAAACDWSEGLAPYTYDSPFQKVWTGAGTLGELAQESLIAHSEDEEPEA